MVSNIRQWKVFQVTNTPAYYAKKIGVEWQRFLRRWVIVVTSANKLTVVFFQATKHSSLSSKIEMHIKSFMNSSSSLYVRGICQYFALLDFLSEEYSSLSHINGLKIKKINIET